MVGAHWMSDAEQTRSVTTSPEPCEMTSVGCEMPMAALQMACSFAHDGPRAVDRGAMAREA